MRASQVVAVALVAGALLTAIGAHAWLQSSGTESASQANVQGSTAVTARRTPAPTPLPAASIPTDSAGPAAAQPAAAAATSLEARMAEAAAESVHHTERYLHSRRDDGQHAE